MMMSKSLAEQWPTNLAKGAFVSSVTSATEPVHFITAGTAILTWAALTFVDIYNNVINVKVIVVYGKDKRIVAASTLFEVYNNSMSNITWG